MKFYVYIGIVVLILLVGCAAPIEEASEEPVVDTPSVEEIPEEEPIEPEVPEKTIPTELNELFEKGKTKIKSYSYQHKSPEIEESIEIYVKGSKIKMVPPEITNVGENKFYNAIYLDTEAKTAEAYCIGYSSCTTNEGKVKDLNYDETYLETPFDWLAKITEAEKIDERTIEGRTAFYIQTNIGQITVSSYNGYLYRVEDDGKVWEFSDAAFDSVKDSDVLPP